MNHSGKIILVDDSSFDFDFVKMALEETSFSGELIWLSSGPDLLTYLKANPHESIYFILLDLKMPQLSGLEVLEKMAYLHPFPFPVILFSASKQESDVRESQRLGATAYITKPVNFNDFTQTIATIWNYWGELNEFSRLRIEQSQS